MRKQQIAFQFNCMKNDVNHDNKDLFPLLSVSQANY